MSISLLLHALEQGLVFWDYGPGSIYYLQDIGFSRFNR